MPYALNSHTVSFRSAAIRFMYVELVWCSRWCRQLINFISCASISTEMELYQIIPCTRVCSHIQPKNYLLLWHWMSLKYSTLSASSLRIDFSIRVFSSPMVHSEHYERPTATGTCSIHLFTLFHNRMQWPAHAIKLILFYFLFCIFDSGLRTIQSYLFVFDSMQCDERSWIDWFNVSINRSDKIYKNFVYCVQFSFRALTSIAFYIANYRQPIR